MCSWNSERVLFILSGGELRIVWPCSLLAREGSKEQIVVIGKVGRVFKFHSRNIKSVSTVGGNAFLKLGV